MRQIKADPQDHGWDLILAGEAQTALGDQAGARKNLAAGSRRFIAALKPEPVVDRERLNLLVRIAEAQSATGDRPAARQTLIEGFGRLAGS